VYEQIGGRRWLVTRDFEIIVMVAVMADLAKWAKRAAAYQLAEELPLSLVAWLQAHERLTVPNAQWVAHDVGNISDSGFGPYTYPGDGAGKEYSAFRLQIPVTIAT
jgi:hypothetical protein